MVPSSISDTEDVVTNPYAGYDIATWLVELAARRGDHPFLIWDPFEGQGRTYSYADLLDHVQRLAGGMAARGVRAGDRVVVHMENCPEAVLVRFACAWLGAVCVATNALAAGPELAYLVTAARAVCAVTQSHLASLLADHCPQLAWIAVVNAEAEGSESAVGAQRVFDFSRLYAGPLPRRPADPLAQASVMYTTGSTSRPKGVVWTHANILWAAELNARQQRLQDGDIHLLFLPLFHVVGLSWCFFSTMWAGGTVVLQPKFSRSRYWDSALRYRASVGSQVHFTMAALKTEPVPDHNFRVWVTSRHDHALSSFYRVSMVAGWGMTEVLTQVIVSTPSHGKSTGGIGRPSHAYQVRVVDDEGRHVKAGETGSLLVGGRRGLSIFSEYDGDERTTEESFDSAGYFKTGDRVRLDDDGWMEFADRQKDIIKVGGENVSAAEVEATIARLPSVKEVAVVGKPCAMYNEVVVAYVVASPDLDPEQTRLLPEVVREHCAQNLARFKGPSEVLLIENLPRIGIGKIAKAVLREWAAAAPSTRTGTTRADAPGSMLRNE
jgi:crotonobetaine/carnitine-CoA ligase